MKTDKNATVTYRSGLKNYYKSLKKSPKLLFSMEHVETILTLPHGQREQKIVEYFLQCGELQCNTKAAA